MRNRYESIHFEVFLKEPERKLTRDEEQAYLSRFYQSIGEKEPAAPCGISRRKPVRRMLLAVAALCVIMAFGAIAGAAGWLHLGDVEDDETAAVHGSSLHKAEQEVYNDEKGITPEEWRKIDDEQWGKGAFEDTGVYDERTHSVTFCAPQKKIQKILDQYHLEYERVHYYVNSAEEAFAGAGIANILGDFKDIRQLKLTGKDKYCGYYIYTDQGSVNLVGGGEQGEPYWELHLQKRNLYNGQRTFLTSEDKRKPEFREWDFVTKEGYAAKAASYVDTIGDEGESPQKERYFQAIVFTENYQVFLFYVLESSAQNLSDTEFESLVGQLDISRLP